MNQFLPVQKCRCGGMTSIVDRATHLKMERHPLSAILMEPSHAVPHRVGAGTQMHTANVLIA